MDKVEWKSLESKLNGATKRELIVGIEKLFHLSTSNQSLLASQFNLLDQVQVLQHYQKRIEELFNREEDEASELEFLIEEACGVVAQYWVATNYGAGRFELLLTVIENASGLMYSNGAVWDTLVDAMFEMAGQLVNIAYEHNITLTVDQRERLDTIEADVADMGYGLADGLPDYFHQLYSDDDFFEEEE